MKEIPLPDNSPKTINRVVEEIYQNLSELKTRIDGMDIAGKREELSSAFLRAKNDEQRIIIIARILGLIT